MLEFIEGVFHEYFELPVGKDAIYFFSPVEADFIYFDVKFKNRPDLKEILRAELHKLVQSQLKNVEWSGVVAFEIAISLLSLKVPTSITTEEPGRSWKFTPKKKRIYRVVG